MSRRTSIGLLVLAVVAGCTVTRGSGNIVSENRNVGAFDSISVSSAIDAVVRMGNDHSVTLEGDDNLLEIVRTRVEGSTLRIDNEPGRGFAFGEVTAFVTLPSLTGVDVSGSSNVEADGIEGNVLVVDISGSGSIQLAGSVSNLEANISGSGSIDGEDLAVDNADISVSGSGSVVVAVDNALRASVSGSGSVQYIGDPAVQSDISGSGSVSQRS